MDTTRAVLDGLFFGRYAASSSPAPRTIPPAPPATKAARARRKTARTPAVGTVTGPGGSSGTYPRKGSAPSATFGILHSVRLTVATPTASIKPTNEPTAPPIGNTQKRFQFQDEDFGMRSATVNPKRIAPRSTNAMPKRGAQISGGELLKARHWRTKKPCATSSPLELASGAARPTSQQTSQDGQAIEKVIQPTAAITPGRKKQPRYGTQECG